jgi:hypothetical protein
VETESAVYLTSRVADISLDALEADAPENEDSDRKQD